MDADKDGVIDADGLKAYVAAWGETDGEVDDFFANAGKDLETFVKKARSAFDVRNPDTDIRCARSSAGGGRPTRRARPARQSVRVMPPAPGSCGAGSRGQPQ
ncbi:hypothetical protein [Kitasatospora sp. NPDC096140]|uniref:hypothetical protein n=1 Tax=Kitasatospora sp. NPDC096140 TaxID=3155425 RepID=UPI003320EBEF